MDLFVGTYYVSVFVQLIALVVQFYGYMLPVTNELMPLKYGLNLELKVSIEELSVYLWISWSLKSLPSVMMKRYLDWFITTNCLLISISLLMIYFEQREIKNDGSDGTTNRQVENTKRQLIDLNIPKFAPILLFNNLMLFFGLLGQRQIISKWISTSVGFFFFFLGFYQLYNSFAKHSKSGRVVFAIITAIWVMYGVAHTCSEYTKNVMYNILDLISKNAFGVFMVYMLMYPNAVSF